LSSQTTSKVASLKDKNTGIRILEIGIGAGANFKYFPEKCSVIAVDPNPQFENMLTENLSKVDKQFTCSYCVVAFERYYFLLIVLNV